jgi:isopenicillin N synthase-like dioxygenase
LKPQAGEGGLQVFTKAGEWIDVPDIEGTFVVNIGDLMAHWTNDEWVSTLHRVVVPERPARRESRRQSVVFFHNPNYDALVSCIPTCSGPGKPQKYKPVQAGEYLIGKYMLAQAS